MIDNQIVKEVMALDIWTSQLWCVLFKRSLFCNVEFPKDRIFEDLAVGYKPYYNCKTDIVVLDRPYYVYNCDNSNSICRSPGQILKRNFDVFLAFQDRYHNILDVNSEIKKELLRKAVFHGLGAYNAGIFYNDTKESAEIINATNAFIIGQKYMILRDKGISLDKRIQLVLFYFFRPIYNLIYCFAYKIQRR